MAIVAFCVKQVTPNNWLLVAVITGLGGIGYMVDTAREEIISAIRAEGEKTRRMSFRAHFRTLTDPEIKELYEHWSKHDFVNHQ